MPELLPSNVILRFDDGGSICRDNGKTKYDDDVQYTVHGTGYEFQFLLDLDVGGRPWEMKRVYRRTIIRSTTGNFLEYEERARVLDDCLRKMRTFVRKTGLIDFLRYVPFPGHGDPAYLEIPVFDLDFPIGIVDDSGLSGLYASLLFDEALWETRSDRGEVKFLPRKDTDLWRLWVDRFRSTEFLARCFKLTAPLGPGRNWRAEGVMHLTNFGSGCRAHGISPREAIVSFIGNGLGRLPPEEESWWWQVNSDPGELVGIEEGQMELYELLDEICPMLWPESRWREWALETAYPEWIAP